MDKEIEQRVMQIAMDRHLITLSDLEDFARWLGEYLAGKCGEIKSQFSSFTHNRGFHDATEDCATMIREAVK